MISEIYNDPFDYEKMKEEKCDVYTFIVENKGFNYLKEHKDEN